VLERFSGMSLLECSLETGRTHQIRVHMASLKHPLVGDPVYDPRHPPLSAHPVATGFARQALHAFRLGLVHPGSGEPMAWEMPLPEDFSGLFCRRCVAKRTERRTERPGLSHGVEKNINETSVGLSRYVEKMRRTVNAKADYRCPFNCLVGHRPFSVP
jgi:hypothetical protein